MNNLRLGRATTKTIGSGTAISLEKRKRAKINFTSHERESYFFLSDSITLILRSRVEPVQKIWIGDTLIIFGVCRTWTGVQPFFLPLLISRPRGELESATKND